MRAKLLLYGGSLKVSQAELKGVIETAGIEVGDNKSDFGVVVGGDGRFSRYGRTESIPLLFVGLRSKGATGSKGYLAQTTYSELPRALERITQGDYFIDEHPRLAVIKNGSSLGEVFTDVYLQRGSESTCLRYKVKVTGKGIELDEAAIGDGVIVSTRAGATGYYSYPDRIKKDWMDPKAFAKIRKNEVGICHVTPTFTERSKETRHPLRYTVPWGCKIALSLFRKADARLYGITDSRSGINVGLQDQIAIVPGKQVTKVISFRRVG